MRALDEILRFRDRASHMRQMAQKARNQQTKQELLVIAQQYDKLAEGVEIARPDRPFSRS